MSHKKLCHLLNHQHHLLKRFNVFGNFPIPQQPSMWPLWAPPETAGTESAMREHEPSSSGKFPIAWQGFFFCVIWSIKCTWWKIFPAYQNWILDWVSVFGVARSKVQRAREGHSWHMLAGIADLISCSSCHVEQQRADKCAWGRLAHCTWVCKGPNPPRYGLRAIDLGAHEF